ncbi:hypothetical protein HFP72_05460 [Nocardiopsis sp. ARC36]
MLDALTGLTTRRPWWVLFAALLAVVGAVVLGSGVADRLRAGQGTEDPSPSPPWRATSWRSTSPTAGPT